MDAPDDENERDVDGLAPHERLREALDARAEALEHAQSALAAAERANDLKDRFLATVSHELRTPLNAISAGCNSSERAISRPSRSTRGLRAIERNARAQARLITDLLDVSHMLHGRLALERETVELGAIAEHAVESMRPVAEAKGVRLLWRRLRREAAHRLRRPAPAAANRDQPDLERREVHARGWRGSCGSQEEDASACVTVVRHRRRHERRNAGGPVRSVLSGRDAGQRAGLGLGLVIVKELVELHGGWIRASSKGAGHGATFKVSLPLLTPGSMTVR